MGVGRAVKDRDERPAGALDSPPNPKEEVCLFFTVYFLLDMADDFIDDFASPSRRAAAFREKAPQVDFGGPPSSVGLAVPHLERLALGAGDCSTRDRPGLAPKSFRLFWASKIRRGRPGRPTLAHEVRDLTRRMCRENPTWGAPRIHGELPKLGIEIGETSASKYMVRSRKPPSHTSFQCNCPPNSGMDWTATAGGISL